MSTNYRLSRTFLKAYYSMVQTILANGESLSYLSRKTTIEHLNVKDKTCSEITCLFPYIDKIHVENYMKTGEIVCNKSNIIDDLYSNSILSECLKYGMYSDTLEDDIYFVFVGANMDSDLEDPIALVPLSRMPVSVNINDIKKDDCFYLNVQDYVLQLIFTQYDRENRYYNITMKNSVLSLGKYTIPSMFIANYLIHCPISFKESDLLYLILSYLCLSGSGGDVFISGEILSSVFDHLKDTYAKKEAEKSVSHGSLFDWAITELENSGYDQQQLEREYRNRINRLTAYYRKDWEFHTRQLFNVYYKKCLALMESQFPIINAVEKYFSGKDEDLILQDGDTCNEPTYQPNELEVASDNKVANASFPSLNVEEFNQTQIEQLYEDMTSYIDQTVTSKEDFIYFMISKGKSPRKPMVWKKKNYELTYFLNALGSTNWDIAAKIFISNKLKPISGNSLSSQYSDKMANDSKFKTDMAKYNNLIKEAKKDSY